MRWPLLNSVIKENCWNVECIKSFLRLTLLFLSSCWLCCCFYFMFGLQWYWGLKSEAETYCDKYFMNTKHEIAWFCSKLQVRETKGIGRSALVPYWCCAMHDEVGLDLDSTLWVPVYPAWFLLAFSPCLSAYW